MQGRDILNWDAEGRDQETSLWISLTFNAEKKRNLGLGIFTSLSTMKSFHLNSRGKRISGCASSPYDSFAIIQKILNIIVDGFACFVWFCRCWFVIFSADEEQNIIFFSDLKPTSTWTATMQTVLNFYIRCNSGKCFSQIRIISTGLQGDRSNSFSLSALEIYGTFYTVSGINWVTQYTDVTHP